MNNPCRIIFSPQFLVFLPVPIIIGNFSVFYLGYLTLVYITVLSIAAMPNILFLFLVVCSFFFK